MSVTLKTPLILVDDEDLYRVSQENRAYRFEREANGAVTVSPNYTNGGRKSGKAYAQLLAYAERFGGQAFDSSSGFALGPGKRTWAPDAAWVSQERIDSLSEQQKAKYWPISPNVAIEVRSETDDFAETVSRVEAFVDRGSQYAVAINPVTREVEPRGTPPPNLEIDFDAIIDG
jgi:Uma2 family endonuclease